jgi:conjugal transfer pilus assembly protein TrbC
MIFVTSQIGFASPQKYVFVSFSMPESLLKSVFNEAASMEIPVILNGLVEDNMRKTMSKLFQLSQRHPELSIQIDPNAFEKYHIENVPALVIDNGTNYDVLFGNMALRDGLQYLKEKGEVR